MTLSLLDCCQLEVSKEEKVLWEAVLPRYRSGRAVAILHQSTNLFYFQSATVPK